MRNFERRIKENPDRIKAVNKEVQAKWLKPIAQLYALGML